LLLISNSIHGFEKNGIITMHTILILSNSAPSSDGVLWARHNRIIIQAYLFIIMYLGNNA